ncbi:hypothetical protein [Embleya sp. AB8]|uniref:hypothetical protein n=1 Tax=Embleya sp. AB8 TaxID=3156304 RepID=UPI003C767269
MTLLRSERGSGGGSNWFERFGGVGAERVWGFAGDLAGGADLRGDEYAGAVGDIGWSVHPLGGGAGDEDGQEQAGFAVGVDEDAQDGEGGVADDDRGCGVEGGDVQAASHAFADQGDGFRPRVVEGFVTATGGPVRPGGPEEAGGGGEDWDP